MLKVKARGPVRSIMGKRGSNRLQFRLRGLRAEARGRAALRPQRLVPKRPAAQMTVVVLGLGATVGGTLLQRRRTRRRRTCSPAEDIAVAIRHRPLLVPSLGAGASALAAGYLFLRRRRAAARRVRDAMTPNPRAADPSMLLGEAAQLMKSEHIGALPVVENGRLVGVLTDRDIVVRVVAEGRDAQSVQIGDIASRELVTADPDQPIDEALRLMARRRVRRLPVVEGERLVGILARGRRGTRERGAQGRRGGGSDLGADSPAADIAPPLRGRVGSRCQRRSITTAANPTAPPGSLRRRPDVQRHGARAPESSCACCPSPHSATPVIGAVSVRPPVRDPAP
jgi:CBS domain-containing protein